MRLKSSLFACVPALAGFIALSLAATAQAQPANDLCSGAISLPVNTIVYSSNATATSVNDGPATTCQANYVKSVWFKFNPATTGAYQVSCCGSPQDTVLAIFSAVDCVGYNNAGFTAFACDDDACATGVPGSGGTASGSTYASIITSTTLTAGANYYIRVSTYVNGVPGPFQIAVLSLANSGACCTNTGACTVVAASSCAVTGTSAFMGASTTCAPSPCQGACCLSGVGTCTLVQPGNCATGSAFQGYNTSCSPNICPAPPANDLCTTATTISPASLPVSVTGSNMGASDETAFAPAVCIASYHDVWYAFTPTISNSYTITTCDALTGNLDTVLSIHDACPETTDNHLLICNDDSCTGRAGPSTIADFPLDGGTRYLIRVATWTGATTGSGPFRLTITSDPIGACCTGGSCAFTSASGCGAGAYLGDGSTCAAGFCQGSCCNDASGACTLSSPESCTSGSTFAGLGTTCAGSPCPTQACCSNSTGACLITGSAACPAGSVAIPGQSTCDGYICPNSHACCDASGLCTVVGTATCPSGTNQGPGTTCTPGLCPIPNDECGPQDPVLTVGTSATGSSAGASTSTTLTAVPTDPYCNQASIAASANDVFWRFTPTVGGDYEVNTCGSTFDTALSIHSACPAADENKIACNDDSANNGASCLSGGTQSRIPHVVLSPGVEYFIRVAGYNGATGDITLTVLFNGVSGACCAGAAGACSVVVNGSASCPAGTVYLGDNTSCTQAACPSHACCNTSTGLCLTSGSSACPAGTVSQGAGSSCSPNPCPAPANDDCATVLAGGPDIVLASGAGSVANGYLGTATPDGVPATCGDPTGADVWYRFTPPSSGRYNILTCNSPTVWDTTVSVWSDCSTQLDGACDDDDCSIVLGHGIIGGILLNGGSTYLIRVAAYAVDTADIAPFTLDVVALGACCSGGTCSVVAAGDHTGCASGAVFLGVGTACAPGACATGVCCRGATCSTSFATPSACAASLIPGQLAASSFSSVSVCNAGGSATAPCCYADYNKSGSITVQDIFDFLSDWFAGSPFAVVGSSGSGGSVTVQNIFSFLGAWFAGGC